MTEPVFEPCAKWAEKLAAPKGDLQWEDYKALTEHVKSCPACSSASSYYEGVKSLLRILPSPEPPPGLPPRIEQLWQDTRHLREINPSPALPQSPLREIQTEVKRRVQKKATMREGGETS